MSSVQGRPTLTLSVQQFNATAAADLIGIRAQIVADGATGGVDVTADSNANLHVSDEATDAFAFIGLDLSAGSMPYIAHTFKRSDSASEVVTVTLAQPIDGNTSYTLDTAGAAITVMPRGPEGWSVVAALGTVTPVP